MEGYQWGSGGRLGEKVQGMRSINYVQNRQGEVKNSIGNVEPKELLCMTRGHELGRKRMRVKRGIKDGGD